MAHTGKISRFFRSRPLRILAGIVVAGVFLSGVAGGVHRGLHMQPDWRDFAHESRYVWEHRAVAPGTSMFGYLPAAYFALWPFTVWSPPRLGLFAFVAVNAAAALATWTILFRRWFSSDPSIDTGAFVWILFLTVGHIQHVLQANQFTIWVLFLCVLGLTLIFRKKPAAGGFILGAAGCIKVTPFLFLVYLALRRQWRALAGMILAVLVLDILPSLAFFGPSGAIQEHRAWARRAEWYSNWRHIEDPLLRVRRHLGNCSYAVVLGRLFSMPRDAAVHVTIRGDAPEPVISEARSSLKPGEHLTIDPMPPKEAPWRVDRDDISDIVPGVRIARLPPFIVWLIWAFTVAAAFTLLFVYTGRRGNRLASLESESPLAALWMLYMMLPTPMMRDYYLALALPAYVVVWRTIVQTPRGTPGRRAAAAALTFFYLGVILIWWHAANWYGLHLWTLAALAAATIWASRRVWRRSPAAPN